MMGSHPLRCFLFHKLRLSSEDRQGGLSSDPSVPFPSWRQSSSSAWGRTALSARLQLLTLPTSATKSSQLAPHTRLLDAKEVQSQAQSQSPSRKTKCLKSGWLFKKRDVLSGWTHRFFKVYSGRVEYFVDESAVVSAWVQVLSERLARL
mmetsp:Transcript_30477/g.56772  ORF Transcript_30477/g.56772 Transcript_30477/m.56772 type:complete len:149 (+) Transcript_30477:114-560(+)